MQIENILNDPEVRKLSDRIERERSVLLAYCELQKFDEGGVQSHARGLHKAFNERARQIASLVMLLAEGKSDGG